MKLATTFLVICAAALTGIGLVAVYSAGSMGGGADRLFLEQLAFTVVGVLLCGFVACQDYQRWRGLIFPFWGVALVLLVVVLFFKDVNGAHRWIKIGKIGFQPSELAKISLVLLIAHYIDINHRFMGSFRRGLVVPSVFICMTLGLIFIEPDRGTTMLLGAVMAIMLLVGGVRFWYFAPPMLLAVAGLVYSLMTDPVRRARIFSWLYPDQYRDSAGYQAWQALIAFGSGGWTGLGLGNGRQKLGYVPEHKTDFIFSVIGEELGLIATLLVLATYVVFVICGLVISCNARDTFGRHLAAGITFLIGLQAFINIGVVTSVLPNKGIALPFISKGGSSMVAVMICTGLLLSVARTSASRVEEKAEEDEALRSPV